MDRLSILRSLAGNDESGMEALKDCEDWYGTIDDDVPANAADAEEEDEEREDSEL